MISNELVSILCIRSVADLLAEQQIPLARRCLIWSAYNKNTSRQVQVGKAGDFCMVFTDATSVSS
jgi:hypothetical protein